MIRRGPQRREAQATFAPFGACFFWVLFFARAKRKYPDRGSGTASTFSYFDKRAGRRDRLLRQSISEFSAPFAAFNRHELSALYVEAPLRQRFPFVEAARAERAVVIAGTLCRSPELDDIAHRGFAHSGAVRQADTLSYSGFQPRRRRARFVLRTTSWRRSSIHTGSPAPTLRAARRARR